MTHLPPDTPAKQLANMIAKLEPAQRKLARTSRAALRRRFPTALELVHDNFHALAIAYSPTEQMLDCIVSLIVHPMGASLSFFQGATLPDPDHLLQGTGDQTRFVRLESAATLTRPEVEALIQAAIAQSKVPLPATGGGDTVIKSIAPSERPHNVLG